MTARGLMATAGVPRGLALPPITYTIPWTLRLTATSQVTRQTTNTGTTSNSGTVATDTTAPVDGGQSNHLRFAGYGGAGTHWYFNDITGAPLDFTNRYLRVRIRKTINTGTLRYIYWRFATSKTAHDAGNYVQYKQSPTPTSSTNLTGTANWLVDSAMVWDGIDPLLATTFGTGADLTSIGYLAVQMWNSGTTGCTIDLSQLQLVQKASTKAKCVFWHDDTVTYGANALGSGYTATGGTNNTVSSPGLASYGWPFTEATQWEEIPHDPTQYPSSSGTNTTYFASSDAAGYVAAGDSFGTHSTTNGEHASVPSASQLQNQAIRNANIARKLNLSTASVQDLAWWGSTPANMSQALLDACERMYRSGRLNTSTLAVPEMLPPAQRGIYKGLLVASSDPFTDPGDGSFSWQKYIDNTILAKGMATFVIHQDLGNATTAGETTRGNFTSLLSYLDARRSQIDVVTVQQALSVCT